MSDAASDFERISAVQARHGEALLRKAHVKGHGIGFARENGADTDQMALIVFVDEKVDLADLDPDDRIPREMDGVRVDVQVQGPFMAH